MTPRSMPLCPAFDEVNKAFQPITTLDMMEEVFKWRMKHKTELGTLNDKCAREAAKERGVRYRPGHGFPDGLLSQQAVVHTLREWYPNQAPQLGTVSKWMTIVNCDNASYFFRRLGEKAWGNVQFTQQEILTDFARTYI